MDYATIDSFVGAMEAQGLVIGDGTLITADDELHRFNVQGDKPSSKNGWFVLYDGNIPAGAFGSWKLGTSSNWCSKNKQDMSNAEWNKHIVQQKEARKQREVERQKTQRLAAIKCGELWNLAKPLVSANHHYLVNKKVKAFNLRQLKQSLLLPIQNVLGQLVNLQFIMPNGIKRFKAGGIVKGCYMVIGLLTDTVFVCEGYATGATIHQATGANVIVAFNAGNLLPVIESVIAIYPRLKLIVAADNDRQTEINIGLSKGELAANQFELPLVYPLFRSYQQGSDFNDLAAIVGLEKVSAQLLSFCKRTA
ncbi:MAG: toprim domain-containing protein [Psychrobium sp.]|nr:toprim domain-containing protein [Psychrobium sp.]